MFKGTSAPPRCSSRLDTRCCIFGASTHDWIPRDIRRRETPKLVMAQDGSWAGNTALSFDTCLLANPESSYRPTERSPCYSYNSSIGTFSFSSSPNTTRESFFRGMLVPWSLTRNVQLISTTQHFGSPVRALPPEQSMYLTSVKHQAGGWGGSRAGARRRMFECNTHERAILREC